MNLPNALTLLRIFFVPLLVAALVQGHVTMILGFIEITNEMLALSIFLLAAATDLLDGYLARRGVRSRPLARFSIRSLTSCWYRLH